MGHLHVDCVPADIHVAGVAPTGQNSAQEPSSAPRLQNVEFEPLHTCLVDCFFSCKREIHYPTNHVGAATAGMLPLAQTLCGARPPHLRVLHSNLPRTRVDAPQPSVYRDITPVCTDSTSQLPDPIPKAATSRQRLSASVLDHPLSSQVGSTIWPGSTTRHDGRSLYICSSPRGSHVCT